MVENSDVPAPGRNHGMEMKKKANPRRGKNGTGRGARKKKKKTW